MTKKNEVLKNTPTVLAGGIRAGENSGIFILEFLEAHENGTVNVLSSTALTEELKKDLYNILQQEFKEDHLF